MQKYYDTVHVEVNFHAREFAQCVSQHGPGQVNSTSCYVKTNGRKIHHNVNQFLFTSVCTKYLVNKHIRSKVVV